MYDHKKYQKKWRKSHKGYGRKWYQKNKVKYQTIYKSRNRACVLRKKYGITLSQYDELLARQDNRCKICKRHKSEFKRNLAVDHHHVTRKVRGLLCHHCNQGLGDFFENAAVMETAISYLKESSV